MADDRPPAFLFYVDDFASDGKVEAMTTEEVGAYILLLTKAWKEDPAGTLPDDDYILSRWARMSLEAWQSCRERTLAPFKFKYGRWHQKRMIEEHRKLMISRFRISEGAKKAAKARWNQQVTCERNANAMPINAISSSSSSSIDKSTSYSCPERKINSAPVQPAFITIPLVHVNGGKPEEHVVTEAEVSEYESLFPAVDVKQQLRNIRAWNLSEPKRRKTRGGVRKHITSWLSREQNRGGNKGQEAEGTGRPVKVDREATEAATIGRDRNGK